MDFQLAMKTAIQEIKRGEELIIILKSHLNPHTQATDLSNGVLRALEAAHAFLKSKEASSSKKRSQKNERDLKRRKSSNSRTIFTPAPHLDGYEWRKYGQKMILKFKYPRNYYRCTHRGDQGCLATKLVQQHEDDDESLMFQVIYISQHTCNPINYLTTFPQIIFDSTPKYKSNFFIFESNNSCSSAFNNVNVGKEEQLISLSPQIEDSSGETMASNNTSLINDFSSWDLDLCEFDFADVDIVL